MKSGKIGPGSLSGAAAELLKTSLEPKEQAIRRFVGRTHETLSSLASSGLKTAGSAMRPPRQSFAAQFNSARFSTVATQPAAPPASPRIGTGAAAPAWAQKLGRTFNSPLMAVAAGLFAPLSFKVSLAFAAAHHIHQAVQQHQAQAAEPYFPVDYDQEDPANFYMSLQEMIGGMIAKAQRIAQGVSSSAETGAPAQAAAPPSPEQRKMAAEKLGVPENSDWKTLFNMKSMPDTQAQLRTQIESAARARSHAYSVQAEKEKHPPELMHAVQQQINEAEAKALRFANQFGNEKDYSQHNLAAALGVRPDSTAHELKMAYYKFARQSHPDRKPVAERTAAKEKFSEVARLWSAYQAA